MFVLADGTVAESSVSQTLRARGEILDSTDLVQPTDATVRALTPDTSEDDGSPHVSGTTGGEGPR